MAVVCTGTDYKSAPAGGIENFFLIMFSVIVQESFNTFPLIFG